MAPTDRKKGVTSRFTAAEAARISGIRSTHMLDYLHRMGIVRPQHAATPGKGKRRHYSYTDLVVLRLVARMLEQGLSVKRLEASLAELRKQVTVLDGDRAASLFLVTDGKNAYWKKSPGEVVDLTASGQFAFSFVLNARQIHSEVIHAMEQTAAA
jgi:DNA-binding transcriptional MerR regulator